MTSFSPLLRHDGFLADFFTYRRPMPTNDKRLIEVAFPLKQVSLDSVHEKNVRHGHISTLHIWPARRPLAAARAALIATLLPDPGTDDARKSHLETHGWQGGREDGTQTLEWQNH